MRGLHGHLPQSSEVLRLRRPLAVVLRVALLHLLQMSQRVIETVPDLVTACVAHHRSSLLQYNESARTIVSRSGDGQARRRRPL